MLGPLTTDAELLRHPWQTLAECRCDQHQPEILVLRLVELVESHLRIGRIQLHVKGGRLDGFMVVAGEPCGTVGGGVGDAEVLRKSRPLVL